MKNKMRVLRQQTMNVVRRSHVGLMLAIVAAGISPAIAADAGQAEGSADKNLVIEHTASGVVAKTVAASEDTPEQAALKATLANEWQAAATGLLPLGARMSGLLAEADDPQIRQELYRFIYSTIGQGYIGLLYADPKHPDFWPIWNQAFNTIDPNPDNVYYMTPVEDNGVYRISGYRGTVRIVSFLIGSGEFLPYGRGNFGPTLADYHLERDVHVRKDGSFEVVLSAERPKGYTGDWWRLPPKASFVNVRQTAYDWRHEVDARLAIERLDLPSIKPRPDAAEIEAKLKQIPTWAENVTKLSIGWYKGLLKEGLVNKMQQRDLSGAGGLKGQRYIEGTFDLQPDEALIIETEVPKTCRYWMFQLTDALFVSIDPLNRQTSLNGYAAKELNGYSARLDRDGKFRAVVAASDPGVPNWLDSAGYRKGILYGRWLECSSYPSPTVTKIKLAELRQHLPTDTPTVSAQQRDASLRLRREGAQMRKRW